MASDRGRVNYQLTYEHGMVSMLADEFWGHAEPLGLSWNARRKRFYGHAYRYRALLTKLSQLNLPFEDQCRGYQKCPDLALKQNIVPRADQSKALQAWLDAEGLGVVCLPTGAGKTVLAMLAIAKIRRPTLILVPTIDLLQQWQKVLSEAFGITIGGLGGGQHQREVLTVCTYDSAVIYADKIGRDFGFLICDEAHHLPAQQYQLAAKAMIAPFRLGLSATPERSDGGEDHLYDLIGPLVYRAEIQNMVESVLAPYRIETIEVALSEEEQFRYQEARDLYLSFVRNCGIRMSGPQGWQEFIQKSSYLPGGRDAMAAFRLQKKISNTAQNKILELWNIMQRHQGERMVVFTNDNATAYHIGESFVLPVITHHTKAKERKMLLQDFRQGSLRVLVTSKVLNEGVDVPEASVAVVVSGSAAVREHVQRLGRILRHRPGKQAILYELIAAKTTERFVNQRRRQHDAYQGAT